MVFKGIIGWIRGRGRKEDEEEEEDPNVSLARNIMEMEMKRDIDEFLTYKPPKRIVRKRRIIYIPPTEYGLKCVKENKIISKIIGGKKVNFRVLFLSKFEQKYFTCGKCKRSFRGIHFGGKIDRWVFLCIKCFKTFPDYVEPKIEFSEEQRDYLSDILERSRS